MSSTSKHILVIRLSAMGDVAMTIPVLEALLRQNKNVKITVLTQKFYEPFFKNLENVSVFPIESKGKHKGLLGLWKLYRELKKYKFTAIADLHNVLRSKVLKLFFSGKNFIQIDKGRKDKKDLISKKVVKELKSTHQRYADVFRALGFQIDLSKPVFQQKRNFPEKIENFLNTLEENKIIGIAPFAAHKGKMYSMHQMKTVIEKLSKKYVVLLFGGKQDVEILNSLEQSFNNVFSTAGKLIFSEELDTISNLDCMLSMDSGNAHLAAMYGIKVVTIWGVTHPYAGFSPFNQPKSFALLADKSRFPLIPTSIYGNKYPKDYENAANSILPETIINKIVDVIEKE